MKPNYGCPLCGCLACPHGRYCRRQPQPETEFRPCPACNCLGTWRFSHSPYTKLVMENAEKREMSIKMNVGAYVSDSQEQSPILSAKEVGNSVSLKLIAVRELKTPKFNGLIFEVKGAFGKRVHFERFEPGYGISAAAVQLKSSETDDWIGEQLKFVTKQGKTGKTKFVNIAFPKRTKKASKKRAKK